MGKYNVSIMRYPTDDDWKRCKALALATAGLNPRGDVVDMAWRIRMLDCRHSPIRTLMFTIAMDVPYWVSVHFVRHKIGVEHYVKSQRNDRQDEYDRNDAPQSQIVHHVMDINAPALMNMAEMRLCKKAAPETRECMGEICDAVADVCSEFIPYLVPKCIRENGCHEYKPCGYFATLFDDVKKHGTASIISIVNENEPCIGHHECSECFTHVSPHDRYCSGCGRMFDNARTS